MTPDSPASRLCMSLVTWAALSLPSVSHAQPAGRITTIDQIGPAITACWHPPAGSAGSEITLRFGLTGKGELRGPPMVTYSKLIGASELQKAFAVSALRAIARCTLVS